MTMEVDLGKIPEKYHAAAKSLVAAGFDWSVVLAFLLQLLDLLRKPKTMATTATTCCPELAAELVRNRDALVEALCANCCACHHAGCHE